MTERTKNLAVGLTVIVALGLLCAMILLFAGLPQALRQGYAIHMQAGATFDLHEGDIVHMSGMNIGRIKDIRFTDANNPTRGVTIVAVIDQDIGIPLGTKAYVYTKGFVGGAYLELQHKGAPPADSTGRAILLPKDKPSLIEMVHDSGNGLLPPEVEPALKGLAKLADNLNSLFAPPAETQAMTAPGTTQPTGAIQGMFAKVNRVLDSLDKMLGNPDNQKNIQATLQDLRKAVASTNEAMIALKKFADDALKSMQSLSAAGTKGLESVDVLAKKMVGDAEKIAHLMDTLDKVVMKIDSGQGTMGLLVNDPKLYTGLVDATRQLTEVLKKLELLTQEWKEQGIKMKLK